MFVILCSMLCVFECGSSGSGGDDGEDGSGGGDSWWWSTCSRHFRLVFVTCFLFRSNDKLGLLRPQG